MGFGCQEWSRGGISTGRTNGQNDFYTRDGKVKSQKCVPDEGDPKTGKVYLWTNLVLEGNSGSIFERMGFGWDTGVQSDQIREEWILRIKENSKNKVKLSINKLTE